MFLIVRIPPQQDSELVDSQESSLRPAPFAYGRIYARVSKRTLDEEATGSTRFSNSPLPCLLVFMCIVVETLNA